LTPDRIPPVQERLRDVEDELGDLRGDVRALTAAIKTAVVLLAGNGALNLADLLR
jgi:hypothetical protein